MKKPFYKMPEHKIWTGIKGRCFVKSNSVFHHYGGIGITMCERWKTFDNFLADMGRQPFPKATIERINTFGDYEPSNCRWATQQEQCWNRRRGNHFITFNGKTQCLAQWAKELNLKVHTLVARKCRGWTDEEALTGILFGPYKCHKTKRTTKQMGRLWCPT